MRLIRSLHFETVACLGRRWPSYEGLIEVDAGKPHSQKPASAICSKCLQTQASEGRRSSKNVEPCPCGFSTSRQLTDGRGGCVRFLERVTSIKKGEVVSHVEKASQS